ncbi:MAG: helix-turn-helix domain-containing protein [Endomicrobium sp.]|jgi:transcriptional regulator with XRE-family HTH domain|nr:helix-turn-helix domain-containing protein [Endomicrobium sp.]
MLRECNLSKDVVNKMKVGSMPSADKLIIIANYLGVSAEYLIGLTDNPAPTKKLLTDEEKLAAEMYKMSPEKRKQLEEFARFLKTQEEFSQELSDIEDTHGKKPVQE